MPRLVRPALFAVVTVLAAICMSACRSSDTSVTGPSSSKCSIALTYLGGVLPSSSGTISIGVTTGRECTWSVSTTAPWLALGTNNGQGIGSVPVTFGENTNTALRQGPVTVGDQTVVLTQAAAVCQF